MNQDSPWYRVVCPFCAETYSVHHVANNDPAYGGFDTIPEHHCDPDVLAHFKKNPAARQAKGMAAVSGRTTKVRDG